VTPHLKQARFGLGDRIVDDRVGAIAGVYQHRAELVRSDR
jgi:hypothetical protein